MLKRSTYVKPRKQLSALLTVAAIMFAQMSFMLSGCAATSGRARGQQEMSLLAQLIETNPRAEVQTPRHNHLSYFQATSGVFRDRAKLTAWDSNTRTLIGTTGTTVRGPVVLNNVARVNG
ncbi:MAG: hypothetical protein FWC85_05215, partial [Elusimicrobia bacterium]|nr:hypothetical protein [Elusimicrobiota bacterium]